MPYPTAAVRNRIAQSVAAAQAANPKYEQSRSIYFSADSGELAFSSDVKLGSLLVVTVAQYWSFGNKGESAITDSQNNIYLKAGNILAFGNGAVMSIEVLYTFAANAAPCTVAINPADSSASASVFIHEFSGITPTNPIDVQGTNISTGTGGNTPSAGPITTTNGHDLLFAVTANDTFGGVHDITKDPDYTDMQEFNNGDLAVSMHSQYRVVSSTLTDTANWTVDTVDCRWGAWVIAFKGA